MSKSRALLCLLCIAAFCTASYAVTADRVTGPLSGGSTVALKGSVHRKALREFDAGSVDPAMKLGSITLLTLPTLAQRKALSQLVADQQNPKSPQYHTWLTPEQWADRFGLSRNDMGKITSWLKSRGFTIQSVARGRNWVVVGGTAGQVAATFGTEIHRFKVNGQMHVANATAPRIPAALVGVVTGIRGLDDFHLRPRAKTRPNYYFSDSLYAAQFIAPGDLATIYDINALYNGSPAIDGTGQKLAVIGQTDIFLSDITDFRTGFGLAAINCATNTNGVITSCSDPHLSYVLVAGLTDPGTTLSGDLSEADLDIELSSAVARGAQIVYVNAPATFNAQGGLVSGGVWDAWYYAVDQNLAPVISLSYGTCEFGDNSVLTSTGAAGADEVELQKANSEGITFVNSTGDTGVAECETTTSTNNPGQLATMGLGLGYPASSPEVTGVGGTSIPLANLLSTSGYWTQTNGTDGNSVANGYIPEQVWNDDLEFYEDCQGNTSPFCTGGNNTGTAITSEATAQNAIGISSSGGGPSNCAQQTSDNSSCVAGFPKPSWQTVTLSGQPSVRYSPDVSFLATPNFPGYIFCTEQSELGLSATGSACSPGGAVGITNALKLTDVHNNPTPPIIGGTSASAPVFAGMIALMNQYLLGKGDISAAGLGNVNQKLYQVAANSNSPFNKVNTGDNNVYCLPGTPTGMPSTVVCPTTGVFGFSASSSDATTGYNLVAGLGSVDANKLAVALDSTYVNFSVAPSTSSVSAAAGLGTSPTTITITPIKNYVGPATYSCPSGLPTGATCSFTTVNSTSATLVINTAANTAAASNITVTVQATDTPSGVSKTTTVSLTVTATTESFTLASSLGSNPTLSVTPGQTSGAVNFTVSSSSTPSFVANSQTALPLTYSCSGLPSESTCNFSPSSTSSATSVSMTVTTTAPTGKLENPLTRGTGVFYAVLFPGLLGIALTIGGRKRSLSAIRMLVLITLVCVSALWMASCGGSSSSNSNPGTPAGSYPITVNATTGGASPIQSSFKFTLSVQ